MDDKATFGKRLRELRRAAGLSADEVARMLEPHGFRRTAQALTAWERGESRVVDLRLVAVLDELLDGRGSLVHLAARSSAGGGGLLDTRLRRVEDQVAALAGEVAAIRSLLRDLARDDGAGRR